MHRQILASIGRYVLTPDIFDTLRGLKAGSGGEIQLADAISIHARQGSVETVRLNGRRFDCGVVDDFIDANNHVFRHESMIDRLLLIRTSNFQSQKTAICQDNCVKFFAKRIS